MGTNVQAANRFYGKYYFACPLCKTRLDRQGKYVQCANRHSFQADALTFTCTVEGCTEQTVGFQIIGAYRLESRCAHHIDDTCVRVRAKKDDRKRWSNRKASARAQKISSGKKSRVIRKGEFPGQKI